jgi:hypothetical protein
MAALAGVKDLWRSAIVKETPRSCLGAPHRACFCAALQSIPRHIGRSAPSKTLRGPRIVPPAFKILLAVVPAEGIEPPTFGLQNRCSTAELSRHSPLLALPHHQITSPKRPQRDFADVPSDACKRAQVALPPHTAQRFAAAAAQAIALSLDWQSKK